MAMPRALGLLLVAATSTCLGCPIPERRPEPAEDCYVEPPGDTSALAQRSVEIGVLSGDEFRPFEDNDEPEIVQGFQGASMMTPYIELPALDADGDEACWWVQIDYMNADTLGNGHRGGLVFERVGDVMRAGPVFEQSAWLSGSSMRMTVTIVGEDFVAVDEVTLRFPDF